MEKEYTSADDSFVINDHDEHLTPIRISLPNPPPLKLIEGYGKKPEDQYFTRLEPPLELINLEKEAVVKTKQDCEKQRTSASPYKAYKTFWDLFESRMDTMPESVEFIKKFWWCRIHGYWCFIHGKPTYISPWHFDYLHLWKISENNLKHPDYRDRDRRWFMYIHYLYTTTETFKNLDNEGKAVKTNGVYEMVDTGSKIFYGEANTKQRRAGETHKSLSIAHSISTTTEAANIGLISYTKDQIEGHWKKKFIPAWLKMPLWATPASQSGATSNSIEYTAPQTAYGEDFINSNVDYAKTSNQSAMDGDAYRYIYCDEEGKTVTVNVLDRWNTLKFCLSAGTVIKGFSVHPSTVEEMDSNGGKEFKALLDQSNFYVRNRENGQTLSGLGMCFFSACDGLEGYIDKYGYSVSYKVEEHQKKQFKSCAYDVLKHKRDVLMEKYDATGDPSFLDTYRSEQRKFPLQYMDSFIGEAGELLPSVFIDRALINNESIPLVERAKRYSLVWENNVPYSRVIPYEDNDGAFLISEFPEPSMQNQMTIGVMVNQITGEQYEVKKPAIQSDFLMGCDPSKYHSSVKVNQKSKRSKCAMDVMKMKMPDDENKSPDEWDGYRTVCTYLKMPSVFSDFVDDYIKVCYLYSCLSYPEANTADVLLSEIEKVRHDGILIFDINKKGQEKDFAGSHTTLQSKSNGLIVLSDYLKMRWKSERHSDLLNQCKNMKKIEDLTHQDLVAAKLKTLEGIAIVNKRKGLEANISFDPESFYKEMGDKIYDL